MPERQFGGLVRLRFSSDNLWRDLDRPVGVRRNRLRLYPASCVSVDASNFQPRSRDLFLFAHERVCVLDRGATRGRHPEWMSIMLWNITGLRNSAVNETRWINERFFNPNDPIKPSQLPRDSEIS